VLNSWYPEILDRLLAATSHTAPYWKENVERARSRLEKYLGLIGLSFFAPDAIPFFSEIFANGNENIRENVIKMCYWLREPASALLERGIEDETLSISRWAGHIKKCVENNTGLWC